MSWRPVAWVIVAVWMLLPSGTSAQTGFRYVHPTDPSCGGHSPCYATIQAAVNAAQPGEHVVVQAGTYVEQVNVTGKNNTANASELDRIVIEADPTAAAGSVVLDGAVNQCTNGHGVRFQQSKFVTLRGLTIIGAGGAAVALMGGNNQNRAIHLERLRIVGNGSAECNGGVTIARGNPDTLVVNSLIYGNGRNGIATIDADGGPHYIVSNTIYGNDWSGVSVTRTHEAFLVNNVITANGTASGSTGGRFGVTRESSTSPQPAGIHLLNNLVCGNRLGEIDGPALDATDSGNLTPTGAEGLGVSASPGCGTAASVFVDAPNVFHLASGSPALDRGLDPRTLGLSPLFNPLFETDFSGLPSVRPKNATGAASARFDMGAFEAEVADGVAPTVTFVRPEPSQYVRGTVAVEALATDAGSGVTNVTVVVEGQSLSPTLTPAVPPPAARVTATASWSTAGFADGAHTITATATDQAGNAGTATRVAIVDNTSPETVIDSGPSGDIPVNTATFTFSGSDNLTPSASLVFAWRFDGGAWNAFGSATTATFTGLAEGQHTFEVKARDLAGNEDATPASRTFAVRLGPAITGIAPDSGTVGTLVTINGANFEAGATVTFNGLPAVVRSISPNVITTTVPVGATTGPVAVVTPRGSATRPFTVPLTGDFTIAATPSTVRAIAGDQGAAQIAVGGGGSFTSLVAPSIAPAMAGITPSFGAPFIAPGASTSLTFRVEGGVAPGLYSFIVTGSSSIDGRTVTQTAAVSFEVLPADTHAVTGRIMTAESIPLPIAGVSVALGSAFVLTDAAGNFVLQAPPPGPNMLFVDGRTASGPDAQFPIVEVQIAVAATGPTRVPFTIYLPKLDTGNAVTLPLDAAGFTTQEVKATTPRIPGLEVTIPTGTRIIGPDGNPVAQIVITPVPIDRSPMPFPTGIAFPLLFAMNPGGSVPSNPLPISFPNADHSPPGASADLYYFDLSIGAWNVWGTGTVSADGTQVVSNPGYGLPRLAWHAYWCQTSLSDEMRSRQANRAKGGEPVDLPTGRFTADKTDLVIPGRLPIAVKRFYRSENPAAGLFGIGWSLDDYETILTSRGSSLALVFPDQSTSVFAPAGSGQWTNTTDPFLRGAVLSQVAGEFSFQLRYKDGTVHRFDRLLGFINAAALAAITDRHGNTITVTRVPQAFVNHRITALTEPAGRSLTFAYNGAGRIASITDPIGRLVQYGYDDLGRLATVTDAKGGITRYTYDANHRMKTITDPRNITFLTNDYDTSGRVIRQTQGDGGVFTFAYELNGPVVTATTLTDPRGNPTHYRFNRYGSTVSITDALGQTTAFEYANGSNLLMATTDPLGRITRFTYDAQGNVASITDPAGTTRGFTYEPTFNKVTSISNPVTPPTQFAYDTAGNLKTITDPRGKNTTLTYNTAGQPLTITDPLSHTTTFTYDGQGNLATIADPLGNTTRFDYDAVGRRTRQIDPRGKATSLGYDALNAVRTITDPLGGVTSFTYDGNGNLLTVTDARPNPPTSYTYDSMDRLETRIDPLGATESFVYDLAGNLTRRTDRKGQLSRFDYDALNRLTTSSYADGSGTTNRYDAAGRLVRVDDSTGGTLTNTYDPLDRLLAQSTPLGTVGCAYDILGRRTQLTVPGIAPTTYGYDENSRLTLILRGTQTTTLDYDDAGRRSLLTLPNGVSTQYQYDAASRLRALVYQNAAGPLGDLTYQYDAAGNRVRAGGSFARTLLPAAVASATYDGANRQLAFGASQMTFDANGNMTNITGGSPTTTLTWDARDRLIGLEQSATLASFTYAFGRRHAKIINGATTQFLYDGLDVAQQLEPQSTTSYLRSLAIDETLALTSADGTFSITADALGSTIAISDGTGSTVNGYTYDPFGTVAATSPSFANPFQFTGRENDGPAGLYYYRARYYHPRLHRFISEDPLGVAAGVNVYSYVGNNPLAYNDPLGLDKRPPEVSEAGFVDKCARALPLALCLFLNNPLSPNIPNLPREQRPTIEEPTKPDVPRPTRPGVPEPNLPPTDPRPPGRGPTPPGPTSTPPAEPPVEQPVPGGPSGGIRWLIPAGEFIPLFILPPCSTNPSRCGLTPRSIPG